MLCSRAVIATVCRGADTARRHPSAARQRASTCPWGVPGMKMGQIGQNLQMTRKYARKLVRRLTTIARRGSERDQESLRREVAKIRWFQQIDLGHGLVTPGFEHSPGK